MDTVDSDATENLLTEQGGCVTPVGAGRLYRPANPVTAQAIRNLIGKSRIIAYREGGNRYQVPRWQFQEKGGLIEGLESANKALMETMPGASDITSFLFFLRPQIQTNGDLPIHALKARRLEAVMSAVAATQF